MGDDPDVRTVAELIKDLRDEATLLLRQEMDLVRTEVSEHVRQLLRHSGTVVAGIVALHLAGLLVMTALVLAVRAAMVALGVGSTLASWLAPLGVGVVVGGIGLTLARRGLIALRDHSVAPRHTLESMREHREWVRERMSS
jgi:hypothetical protein